MAAGLASPRGSGRPHSPGRVVCEDETLFRGGDRLPGSSYKITPYGHETCYPYGHYERPINPEGPLDDIKQKIRQSKTQNHLVVKGESDCCDSDDDGASDGELDESPRRHKLKKLGVL